MAETSLKILPQGPTNLKSYTKVERCVKKTHARPCEKRPRPVKTGDTPAASRPGQAQALDRR